MRGATGYETSDPKADTTIGTHPKFLFYTGASFVAENRDPLFRTMRWPSVNASRAERFSPFQGVVMISTSRSSPLSILNSRV